LLRVAAGCCWLLLAAAGCCWLLLAAAGCCWLLLLAAAAAGCCCWLLLLGREGNVRTSEGSGATHKTGSKQAHTGRPSSENP
jgi:hypothetical protein